MEEFEKFLLELKIPGKKAEAILDHVRGMIPGAPKVVEIDHSRVITERIEAYGLEIELDAHGDAVTVEFPRPAQVIEEWTA